MQRFTIGDAAELAGDVGPDPRLIGVLAELDAPIDLDRLRTRVAERIGEQPILSRRFVRQGKAAWSASWEQVGIDVVDHVFAVGADDPVAAAVEIMVAGLPETIPMWRLLVLRSPGATHLLFVAHHVLLDGATAVAVVGSLLGAGVPAERPAAKRRWTAILSLLAATTRGSSATSLLTPLTSGFRLASVEVDLGPVHRAARRAGATVNDVLLVAIADAVRAVAARRGERLRRVVASVPMTGIPTDPGGRNQVGAFLISIPERRPQQTDRELLGRLAVRTRRRKLLARGSSGSFALSAVLAGLGRLGWYRPMFERQRAITTLVTNLRGPVEPLTVHGVGVRSLTPISPALGNVTMVFAAVSHAGRLRVTAPGSLGLGRAGRPDRCPAGGADQAGGVQGLRARTRGRRHTRRPHHATCAPVRPSGRFGSRGRRAWDHGAGSSRHRRPDRSSSAPAGRARRPKGGRLRSPAF